MDGWESRRKRTPGHDWVIIRLGLAGAIRGVDIDTNHFLGNNPSYASIEATDGIHSPAQLASGKVRWTEILAKSPIRPGSQNLFSTTATGRSTLIRLHIYPDGGVARLRVYGEVMPDWNLRGKTPAIDLASVTNGGVVIAASDMFFGSKENLIMPGRALNMGDGWETKRRRERCFIGQPLGTQGRADDASALCDPNAPPNANRRHKQKSIVGSDRPGLGVGWTAGIVLGPQS